MDGFHATYEAGTPPVLHVVGELDLATEDRLRGALREAFTSDPAFVLDLGGVGFVDASGVRVILEAAASKNGHGPLVIHNGALLRRLLVILDLDEIPSVEFAGGE